MANPPLTNPLMAPLSVVTLNTRGLNDPVKCQTVFDNLHGGPGDIFLLQECNIPYKDNYTHFQKRWSHGESFWSGDNKNRSSGVAVLLKGWGFNIQRVQHVIAGRVLSIDIEWDNASIRLINVYCPSELSERLETLKALQPLLVCGREVILGGDFNCLVDRKDRLSTSAVNLDASSGSLQNIVKDFRLSDAFRVANPSIPGYTWSNGRTHSRIDFIFMSMGLQVVKASVTPTFFSDHSKLNCSLVLKGNPRSRISRSTWKLNVSLLQDVRVVGRLREKIIQWSSLRFFFDSVGDWWEEVKNRAKLFLIEVGKKAAKKKRFVLQRQQAKLQRLYTLAQNGFEVRDEISQLKRDMLLLSAEVSRGLITRSRIQHLEGNEKCSRYFFRKLTRTRNTMGSIKDQYGNEITEGQDILTTVQRFYADLYKEEDLEREALERLLSCVATNLRDSDDVLDCDLTEDDLTKALESMENNKAPGADGLPKEFYTTFWDVLKAPLLTMYKEGLAKGTLPASLREGTISLLFKKGDKKDIKNWRPLTLLGVDRKILAKALFLRLQGVVGKVVAEDQTCVVPGRSMGDSLALVRDAYLYAVDRKAPLAIAGLDLEKAFDRINHTYLKEVLGAFGLGPKMRAWIDLLYTNCESKVTVNGMTSESFQVKSGVRQGCPLSVILFILAMEPLACAIRQDASIQGLQVPGAKGKDARLTLYMDDMTILCTNNNSLIKTLEWSDVFAGASGAKLNRSKSEIKYVNWWAPKLDLGLKENTTRIKILGVEIGENMAKANWDKRLPGIQGKLLQWQDRELSMTGKVLVVKAEVLASLTFLAMTLPAPRSFILALTRIVFRFIWGANQENISREIMYRPLEKGGKSVPDMASKLNAMFVTPIANAVLDDSNRHLWYSFAKFWAGYKILTSMGRRPPLNTPRAETRPALYQRALDLWKATKLVDPPIGKIKRLKVERGLAPQFYRMVPVGTMIEKNCSQVWKNVNCKFLLNHNKDLAWKAAQNCLPTKAFLKRRRCSRNAKCPRPDCSGEENVKHLFWSCNYAQKVWGLTRPWLKELFKDPREDDVMYGHLEGKESKKWERWWAVINCVKEGLWRSRNLVVFKRFNLEPEAVARVCLTLVRDYVLREKKMYSDQELIERWVIRDGLISITLIEVLNHKLV